MTAAAKINATMGLRTNGMRPNPGYCPAIANGKRVLVELHNGRICGGDLGWAADGKQGCRWSLTGNEWDIAYYQVIG